MAGLNKIILIGRLGRNPEVYTSENGHKKISVSLATSERYRDKEDNWQEQTDWHNIIAIGNLALDIAEGRRNYSKGDLMYVEGKLRYRQYTNQNGVVCNVTEILADRMMQLAPARTAQQSSYGQPYAPATEPAPTGYMPQNFGQVGPDAGDDLPF